MTSQTSTTITAQIESTHKWIGVTLFMLASSALVFIASLLFALISLGNVALVILGVSVMSFALLANRWNMLADRHTLLIESES